MSSVVYTKADLLRRKAQTAKAPNSRFVFEEADEGSHWWSAILELSCCNVMKLLREDATFLCKTGPYSRTALHAAVIGGWGEPIVAEILEICTLEVHRFALEALLDAVDREYKQNVLTMAVVIGSTEVVKTLMIAYKKFYYTRKEDRSYNPEGFQIPREQLHLRKVVATLLSELDESSADHLLLKWYCDAVKELRNEEPEYAFHAMCEFLNMYEVKGIVYQPQSGTRYRKIFSMMTTIVKRIADPSLVFFLFKSKNNWGMTPLHAAISSGRSDIVKLLLNLIPKGERSEESVNARDGAGRTPLHRAAAAAPPLSGSVSKMNAILKYLLDDPRTDVNAEFVPLSAFQYRAFSEDDLCRRLTISGKLPPLKFGYLTPLHLSILTKRSDRVTMLIEHRNCRPSNAKLRDTEAEFRWGKVFAPPRWPDLSLRHEKQIYPDIICSLPLFIMAVLMGEELTLRCFLLQDTKPLHDIGTLDRVAMKPLHDVKTIERVEMGYWQKWDSRLEANDPAPAYRRQIAEYDSQLAELLRQLAEDKRQLAQVESQAAEAESQLVEVERQIAEYCPMSMLHVASCCGNPRMLELILDSKRIDPMVRDTAGHTALHYAADAFFLDIDLNSVEYFVDLETLKDYTYEKLKLDASTPKGYGGKKACIRVLLQAGLEVWSQNKHGLTPSPGQLATDEDRAWWHEIATNITKETKRNLMDSANGVAVTAALVATTTFMGPSQPPLGFPNGYLVYELVSMRVFIICISLSFYVGMASIVLSLLPSLYFPRTSLRSELRQTRKVVIAAVCLLLLAIVLELLAFAAAIVAILPKKEIKMTWSTSIVGAIMCIIVFFFSLLRLFRLVFNRKPYFHLRRLYDRLELIFSPIRKASILRKMKLESF